MKTTINIKTIAMKKLLFLLLLFTGFAFAQPVINNPSPLEACVADSDGFYNFNLNEKKPEILGSLSPLEHYVAYYRTLADAESNSFEIPAFLPFANDTPYTQTLYVRVIENSSPNNPSYTTLELVVNSLPSIVQPPNLVQNDVDGIALFNLTVQTSLLISGNSNISVTYFGSLVDAEAGGNNIINSNTYLNASNPQTIYTRVENQVTGCFSTTSFDLIVNTNPFPINNPTPLQICDDNNDGFASFDLSSKDAEILGALNPLDYTVSYHVTVGESENGNNPLPSPYINLNPMTETIYVRVMENVNGNNYATTTLDLIVNLPPYLPTVIPALYVYENPNDGLAVFDLTQHNSELSNNDSSLVVTYYLNQIDAISQNNAIPNSTSYNGSNLETIWANVINPVSDCVAIGSFLLKTVDSNLVVYIPNNIFKTKLLSANSSNTVAKDLTGNFTSIDTNGNGEIEFTEALNISYLDVNQSSIPDMTGISSFTNLTYLDCRSNLVLSTLDVSSLTNLTYLNAYYAGLNSITLTPSIVTLNISSNNITGSLDLTTFTNLQTFISGSYNNLNSINLSGLTNLTNVDCSTNDSLTSLNVAGCIQLSSLNCNGGNLPSLNLTGLSALTTLDCSYNQISNLDVTGSPNLQSLLCGGNNISTLNIGTNTILSTLVCENNELTTLDVTNCPNIQLLYFYANTISSIDLSNNVNLTNLYASGNNLTSLDLSNNSQLIEVLLSENPLLTYVSLKNGSFETIVAFDGSTNIQFVCADDNETQYIMSLLQTALVENVVVNSYCSFTPAGNYNTITGNISFDFNNNGCDANDVIQPNVRVDINDGTMQGATFTDTNGNYTFYTQTGDFDIFPSIDNSSLFAVSPVSNTITFANNNNNTATQNFCMTAVGVSPDVEIVIVPIDPARPGFDAKYDVVIKNKGNQSLSGDINFNFNDAVLDFINASEAPTLQNDGLLTWNYVDLLPFENRNIEVILNVNSPMETPAVNNGDLLSFSATVNPIDGDIIPGDNSTVFNQIVVGSYDPNDITCLEGETVSPSEIGNYLHYIINFENTGTFMAQNIVVKTDINPAELDINSLQLLSTSHSSYVRIIDNTVEFVFENINLEAKQGNPPVGGHGNVLFKIKSNNELNTNDYVTNRANIYFDYNFPIETNIAQTTFATLNNPIVVFDESVQVFPNPTNGKININSDLNIKSIELYDIQGRVLMTSLENSSATTLDISNQQNGVYFLKINTIEGSKVEKIMKE